MKRKLTKSEVERKLQQLKLNPSKEFWENSGLISTLDMMAQRYGCLPSDLLNLSTFEFTLNTTIMLRAIEEEKKRSEQNKEQPKGGWGTFGISYERK